MDDLGGAENVLGGGLDNRRRLDDAIDLGGRGDHLFLEHQIAGVLHVGTGCLGHSRGRDGV